MRLEPIPRDPKRATLRGSGTAVRRPYRSYPHFEPAARLPSGETPAQAVGIDDMDAKISDAVRHAPEWVRHDLLSDDKSARERAEETLAAIISNALRLKAA
jgi:hypothetical protein